MSCAVCGAGPGRPKLRKDGVEILACPSCGLEYWLPPEGFRAEDTYDAAYFDDAGASHGYSDYAGMEHAFRTSFARRLARLPPPGAGERLLDVGAAYGYAVLEAERRGWQAFGLELASAAAREAARQSSGRVVAASGLATPFASASFDVVTLWDVLEHLPEPHAAIAEIARVLRPGGRLLLSTGDVGSLAARVSGRRWHLYTLPEHLFFYTRRSLDLLLEAHGLRVEAARAYASYYTLGYLVERLRKSLLGHAGARGDWPGSKLCLPVNLFDIVTVTARRVEDPKVLAGGVARAAGA
ncbi:MAG: class I SAM-dependent methyltransferase [Deltaproteobacteria bacterium]|nr:class I SAM-dependent methyltransferase [Deltaproteobacteria bacterium]MBW2417762.1 class I SAM-dependent methyltransferase [Deltaproteobacteria bacterium]